jgi:hypothetical protein
LDFRCFSLFLDFSKILSKRWVKNWVTTKTILEKAWSFSIYILKRAGHPTLRPLFRKSVEFF